jgi:hypothetical protein
VRGGIARHPARGVGHEAGVGRLLAALREVPAQAGEVLFVGAAACQVIPSNELQHVGGERVERDHSGWTDGSYVPYGEPRERVLFERVRLAVGCVMCCVMCYGQTAATDATSHSTDC